MKRHLMEWIGIGLILFPFFWTIGSYIVLRLFYLPKREARRYAKQGTVVWLVLAQYAMYQVYFSEWAFLIVLLWTSIYFVYVIRERQLFLQPVTLRTVIDRFWQGSFTWYTFGYCMSLLVVISWTFYFE